MAGGSVMDKWTVIMIGLVMAPSIIRAIRGQSHCDDCNCEDEGFE